MLSFVSDPPQIVRDIKINLSDIDGQYWFYVSFFLIVWFGQTCSGNYEVSTLSWALQLYHEHKIVAMVFANINKGKSTPWFIKMCCSACFHVQVPESLWHVSGRCRGVSGICRFCVGWGKQAHNQELQEEESHSVCDWRNGHKLLCAVAVWRCHGLHLWNHFSFAVWVPQCHVIFNFQNQNGGKNCL